MQKVVTVLKPFEKATKLLQSNDASISLVIPVITTILKELDISPSNEDLGVKTMKRALKSAMLNRFCDIEKDEKFILASFCDPRIKCCFFQDKSTKDYCIERITLLIQNKLQNVALVPSNQSTNNDESNISVENSFEKTMNEI